MNTTQIERGDWIQTYTGRQFYPLDARPEDFDIRDIAHALANTCRFGGHVKKFYSVAEHSVRCARFAISLKCDRMVQFQALMHDASEAYLCDIPRPLKHTSEMSEYRRIEKSLEHTIAVAFGLPVGLHEEVKKIDNILLGTEARDLMLVPPIKSWHLQYGRLDTVIKPWSPRKAKREFLRLFYKLNLLGIVDPKPSLLDRLSRIGACARELWSEPNPWLMTT